MLLIGHPVLDQTDLATPPAIGHMGLTLGETVRRPHADLAAHFPGRRLTPGEVRLHQSALRKIVPRCQLVLGTEEEFAELAEAGPLVLLTDMSAAGPKVVMTRGSLGAVVAENGRLRSYTAVIPPSVVDTTGAGDAFAAGFLLSTTAGGDTDDAMTSAATLAAHMVGHLGGWACDCREPGGVPR
ncbi:PfkB family carbohydrate kinase [Streptomyces resistomycificus]|uniref:Carbohydrate kinase PfkB domain-containing protein n=1 Tax=Streptomyces resistomycificus TaxID=67356 RepID=A0A0L8LFY1_9ACTN|nr:PfkB family carbohydrate kinase [Streptomyces resistomycificus]KOG37032.1 hypothetical protein ADK37_11385 [Streptomyces resistomycificus]KUN94977.1 hypothetical protein AQJ84_23105 [Streptomyces resistomycificus]